MTTDSPVLILDRDAEDYAERLADLAGNGARLLTAHRPDALPEQAGTATVVLGEPAMIMDVVDRLPALVWVQSTWAGLTPLLPLARRGVAVTGVKEVFGGQMAEYVMAGLLQHSLKLREREAAQRERRWWPEPTGTLAGQTLGVMGTGSIGSVVAERAAAFGMQVLGYSRSGMARPAFDRVFAEDALQAFLGACDHVAAVLPDTPETRGLLDRPALAAMRPGALLINVGRGTLVEEKSLLHALETGHLGGAMLDVFTTEPLPPEHPFWSCPGLLMTAHVAARSWPRDIAAIFRDNFLRFRAQDRLRFRLDPERGY